MKITYKGDYALKAILQLALKYSEGQVASINEIATSGDMPTKFLEQILLLLKKGGFVKAKRGVNGGFYLARPPAKITIGEVVRFIEGPIEPISCVGEDCYKGCKDITSCMFRDVWKEVSAAISVVVDTVTFEDLVVKHKEKTLKISPVFNYTI
ncbi:MAG: Rrf2 family transcriptional regulator [Candidatus Omnitrophica bacterium]|nr:Rrf2 family transcriptional regulator [Candidatus Omnitrophota bacterium]MDD5437186.1 Rrf2 family transcriptional regulator [Candidatus Omnitrophota bacterium]